MGILRADVISHSQLSDGNGSVLFDGTTDSITIPSHSALAFGISDYTVEGWFYFTDLVGDGNGQQTLVGDTYGATNGFYLYKRTDHKLGWYYDGSNYWNANTLIETGRWYHLAFVRHGGTARIYIDGVLDGEDSDTYNATVTQYYIGDTADQTSGEFFGYMSNLRITRTAVYKDNFTVPKFKLKEIPGTILLCCQSSSSTTEAAVSVAGTLTANGNPTATNFGPGLKEDIKDTGVVFDGFGNFATSTYMIPPIGKTEERNRGRGVVMGGGRIAPSSDGVNNITFVEIQSQGNTQDFGDLTEPVIIAGSLASSTRAIRAGGYKSSPGSNSQVIDFVTITNTANATTFGELLVATHWVQSGGNQTRGVMAGGNGGGNTIQYLTIASTGNSLNFGDLVNSYTTTVGSGNAASSPTRMLIAGGITPGNTSVLNDIQYITIASTGDATDFANLDGNKVRFGVCSNSTRAVYGGGGSSSEDEKTNNISFVTIATTGDAVDFGDRTVSVNNVAATSNATRGVFIGGRGPSASENHIDFVLIASRGDATDFGDCVTTKEHTSACSDSHGGIS